MSEKLFLKAIQSQRTSVLVINGKDLTSLPSLIQKMNYLKVLDLKFNQISKLCPEFINLTQAYIFTGQCSPSPQCFKLRTLNLGNNKLEEVPEELRTLNNLETLYLSGNLIKSFSSIPCAGLVNLNFLNMNNNLLLKLPPEINRLKNLKYLSLNHNRLIGIPKELCSLTFLYEIQLNYNQIVSIPEEFRDMKNLSRLSLARNCIKEFPIVLCVLKKLRVLDLAGNFIQTVPKELQDMKLRVFFCEENPFVKKHPIYIEQKEDILTLKEITARYILNEMTEQDPWYLQGIEDFPEILNILARKRTCVLCGKRVLFPDIKCVTFKHQAKKMKKTKNLMNISNLTIKITKLYKRERQIITLTNQIKNK
uniref:Leucine rich repeat containing 69 n=1 Tax=Monodelphis domestica TaxID=13616 RepID=A0A5F8GRB1_MONDO